MYNNGMPGVAQIRQLILKKAAKISQESFSEELLGMSIHKITAFDKASVPALHYGDPNVVTAKRTIPLGEVLTGKCIGMKKNHACILDRVTESRRRAADDKGSCPCTFSTSTRGISFFSMLTVDFSICACGGPFKVQVPNNRMQFWPNKGSYTGVLGPCQKLVGVLNTSGTLSPWFLSAAGLFRSLSAPRYLGGS